jgi:hypothetical protein
MLCRNDTIITGLRYEALYLVADSYHSSCSALINIRKSISITIEKMLIYNLRLIKNYLSAVRSYFGRFHATIQKIIAGGIMKSHNFIT